MVHKRKNGSIAWSSSPRSIDTASSFELGSLVASRVTCPWISVGPIHGSPRAPTETA